MGYRARIKGQAHQVDLTQDVVWDDERRAASQVREALADGCRNARRLARMHAHLQRHVVAQPVRVVAGHTLACAAAHARPPHSVAGHHPWRPRTAPMCCKPRHCSAPHHARAGVCAAHMAALHRITTLPALIPTSSPAAHRACMGPWTVASVCLCAAQGMPVRCSRPSVLHVSRKERGRPSAPVGATRQTIRLRSTLPPRRVRIGRLALVKTRSSDRPRHMQTWLWRHVCFAQCEIIGVSVERVWQTT